MEVLELKLHPHGVNNLPDGESVLPSCTLAHSPKSHLVCTGSHLVLVNDDSSPNVLVFELLKKLSHRRDAHVALITKVDEDQLAVVLRVMGIKVQIVSVDGCVPLGCHFAKLAQRHVDFFLGDDIALERGAVSRATRPPAPPMTRTLSLTSSWIVRLTRHSRATSRSRESIVGEERVWCKVTRESAKRVGANRGSTCA